MTKAPVMKNLRCLRCDSPMQVGYQVDGLGRTSFRQSCWAAGPPEGHDVKFLGLDLFEKWALKIKEEDLLPIVTLRCATCGLLEHYAPPTKVEPPSQWQVDESG